MRSEVFYFWVKLSGGKPLMICEWIDLSLSIFEFYSHQRGAPPGVR